jgi:lipid-binding SYLF domain-containing protein
MFGRANPAALLAKFELSPKEEPVKRSLIGLLSLVAMLGSMAFATAKEDSVERLQNAGNVLKEIMSAPDKGIPEEVLDNAKCIVVVPHLIKAGFIVGGKHGRGVASCRTATGWSAPAFVSVGGGSWGLQIGAEGIDLVMLVMNDKGLQHLLSSKFEISGEGSAAAGPVGRHASAGTDWKLNSELLTYSRSKGAFAGLTLEGAVIEQDADSTTAIYGQDVGFRKTLMGNVKATASAEPFMSALAMAGHQAAAKEADKDMDKK